MPLRVPDSGDRLTSRVEWWNASESPLANEQAGGGYLLSAVGAATAREDAVLVVDDDHNASASLATVLRGDGLQVMVAGEPSEAMAIQYHQHPAAIVVAHDVANESGLELANRLKVRDPEAAVLLLTSLASLEQVLPAAAKLDGVLVKPLVPQVFVQSVRNALSIRTLQEENRRLASDATRATAKEPGGRPGVETPDLERFSEKLDSALATSQRDGGPLVTVLLEIGGLEAIADQAGPAAADEAVAIVASRLTAKRRKSDLVGRVSANRFAVACCDVRSPSDCRRIVRILLDEVEGSVVLGGTEHWLTPTAGAVVTDPSSPSQRAEALLDEAEVALVCARDEGRSWRMFEKSMRDKVLSREAIGTSVREALDNEELTLVYQPVTELQSARVVGAAVRLQWNRDDEPVFLSSEFLSQEADLALSAQVNAWMLDRAFADLAACRDAKLLEEGFRLALSVSARDVADPQFAETIEELLEKHEISATMLSIDMSGQAASAASTGDTPLSRLGQAGAVFNIDDFGSTEMRLSWLRELPVKALKLDAPLVESLDSTDDLTGTALVRALIALGHEMHMAIVGKGVTTPAQRAALLAMGCEFAQDSRFAPPGQPEQPAAQAESMVGASSGRRGRDPLPADQGNPQS